MKMYDLLPKGYRAQYGSGNALLSEMIVRAVTIRLLFICQGQKQADAKLEFDISQGFTWVEPICRLLKEYEMQRTLYPSIDLFIPQLVHSLIELI